MKPMKKTSAAAAAVCSAALAASLALSGCASQGTGQPQSASAEGADAPEKLTLVLDYVPNTNHTGIYVAIDKGYYADAGLEVDVVQPPDDGADALVGSGKAQLGIGFQDVMANYLGSDDPLPVTAIAALVQHNTSGIASRQGEGIDRPAGLVGHAYGTWDQDVEKAVLRSIVETDGGDWDEVALVPANSTDEIAGLRTGTFDAAWVYEGWALQNAKVQGYPVDYFSIRSIDDTFDYYTPVVIANDAWLPPSLRPPRRVICTRPSIPTKPRTYWWRTPPRPTPNSPACPRNTWPTSTSTTRRNGAISTPIAGTASTDG